MTTDSLFLARACVAGGVGYGDPYSGGGECVCDDQAVGDWFW